MIFELCIGGIEIGKIVLWGRGSEWFWQFVQTVVVAAGIFIAIRQIKVNRQANLLSHLGTLDERWNNEKMLKARSVVCANRNRYNRRMANEEEAILNFFEDVGMLLRKRYFDEDSVWNLYSTYVEHYWPILRRYVMKGRTTNDTSYYENFEYLYEKIKRYSARKGIYVGLDEEEIRCFVQSEVDLVQNDTK